MNTSRTLIRLGTVVLVAGLAAGLLGESPAGTSREVSRYPTAVGVPDVAQRGEWLHITVEARGANALEARRQFEDRLASIRALADAHGGTVTMGDSRYLRPKPLEGAPRAAGAGFLIIQGLDIELSGPADRAGLEAELARLRVAEAG